MLPLAALDLPPGWEAAAAAALRIRGVVLVLGGTDCGKSTFCRYVLSQALAAGQPIALLDGDLGQSHLGPPATLGLNLYPPHRLEDAGLHPDALYFIGQTSPPGRMLELVVGLSRLAKAARSRGCPRLLVNTSGFISGPPALRLKLAKAEALAPQLVIGLQRQEELEPILAPLRRSCPRVLTLPVSGQAQPKFPAQRRLFRQARFAAYFQPACPRPLDLDRICWLGFPFGQGRPWDEEEKQRLGQFLETPVLYAEELREQHLVISGGGGRASDLAGACGELGDKQMVGIPWGSLEMRLVGLLNERLLALGLGLLLPSAWERRQIILYTPLPPPALARVRFCRLGKLRLDFSGEELPFSGNLLP